MFFCPMQFIREGNKKEQLTLPALSQKHIESLGEAVWNYTGLAGERMGEEQDQVTGG